MGGFLQIVSAQLPEGPQLFALVPYSDGSRYVWTCQTKPSGGWTTWSEFKPNARLACLQIASAMGPDNNPILFGLVQALDLPMVYICRKTSGGWTDWDVFQPNARFRQIGTCQLTDGRAQLFGIDKSYWVWTCWQENANPNSAWTSWVQFQDLNMVGMSSCKLSDGRPQVFGIYPPELWTCWREDTAPLAQWTDWGRFSFQGLFTKQITSCQLTDNTPQLFAIHG